MVSEDHLEHFSCREKRKDKLHQAHLRRKANGTKLFHLDNNGYYVLCV